MPGTHKFVGRLENGQWAAKLSVPELAREDAACAQARDGGLWILLGRELRRIRGGVEDRHLTLPEGVGGLWSISEDSSGNVWIASHSSGFRRVAPDGTMRRFDSAAGVSEHGRCIYEDREKNLWLGSTGDGLIRLRPQRFRLFELHSDRKGAVINSIWPEDDGVLAATYGEGLYRLGPQGAAFQKLPTREFRGYLQSVLRDRAGRLWIGFDHEPFVLLEDDKMRVFARDNTAGNNTMAIFEDSKARVWLNGEAGATVYDGKEFLPFRAPEGSSRGKVECFAEDAGGNVWAATDEGVYRLENEKRFVEILTSSGKPVGKIQCLAPDRGGAMWLGSADRGLLRWKDGRLTSVDRRVGFPVEGVGGIIADGDGHFWMTAGRSLVRAAIADLNHAADGSVELLTCQVFGASDGLPHAEFTAGRQPTCVRDPRGRLWFASTKGAVMTDPAALTFNEVPPPVRVSGISFDTPGSAVFGRVRTRGDADDVQKMIRPPYAGAITLPPGSRHITIHYEALSFAAPEKVRFQNKLDGVDANWRDAGPERITEFFELPAAAYTFHVRAANNDGVWNETGDSIAFTIQPYLWETWWFRAGGAASLVAIGAAIARWRVRRRHRQKLDEMRRVQQQQAELAHLSRVATMGHLASALAHEINQPLGAILRNSEAATLYLQNPNPDLEEIRAILMDIQRDDQRAGAVIDRMRSLLKRRNIEMRPLEVPALVADTVSLAQSDARSRHVRLTVDLQLELPPVKGDRVHLQQVLLNLLINAMDAVRDSPDGSQAVTVGAVVAGGEFIGLSVSDTGHGIPPEKLGQVFDPFFTSKTDGMGVGLAISRTIIEAHGGRIWAENNAEGIGATFRFTVPVARESSVVK